MRDWLSALLITGTLLAPFAEAQQMMPVGIVRGKLVTWLGGMIGVRRTDGAVYDCFYDSHTLFQRNQWPIQAQDLTGGEPVEVLSDRKPGSRSCYTRMLSVVYTVPATARPRPKPAAETFAPRGYLTFSGLVTQRDANHVTLKTRTGEKTLLIRADTNYSSDGLRIDAPETLVNKHVFIRAGRDLHGALEAYQVMWGEMLAVP